jgi:hypothetical protein
MACNWRHSVGRAHGLGRVQRMGWAGCSVLLRVPLRAIAISPHARSSEFRGPGDARFYLRRASHGVAAPQYSVQVVKVWVQMDAWNVGTMEERMARVERSSVIVETRMHAQERALIKIEQVHEDLTEMMGNLEATRGGGPGGQGVMKEVVGELRKLENTVSDLVARTEGLEEQAEVTLGRFHRVRSVIEQMDGRVTWQAGCMSKYLFTSVACSNICVYRCTAHRFYGTVS